MEGSDRALNKETKVRLMRALVWPVATYDVSHGRRKLVTRRSGFEMTAYRRMLRISWKDHRTNQSILELDTTAEWHTAKKTQVLWACGDSRQSLHIHPSRPYCRHKETWKTTNTLDGRHQRLGPNYQWLSAWELHKTEQHGVQRCRWLWLSTLRNEEDRTSSSPVQVKPFGRR